VPDLRAAAGLRQKLSRPLPGRFEQERQERVEQGVGLWVRCVQRGAHFLVEPVPVVDQNGFGADLGAKIGTAPSPRQRRLREVGVGTGNGTRSKATQFKPKYLNRPPVQRVPKPSRLLKDMRFVYGHWDDDENEPTPGQYHCREWLEKDPKGFWSTMARMEEAFAAELQAARRERGNT
jgi:hypothetical protein